MLHPLRGRCAAPAASAASVATTCNLTAAALSATASTAAALFATTISGSSFAVATASVPIASALAATTVSNPALAAAAVGTTLAAASPNTPAPLAAANPIAAAPTAAAATAYSGVWPRPRDGAIGRRRRRKFDLQGGGVRYVRRAVLLPRTVVVVREAACKAPQGSRQEEGGG